jgi:exonuclease SbcC
MIPVELELHNFLAYRDPGPLNLEGVHIACLAGPNGAGKSSLLDAITWALWGKARSSSVDDLVHQGQKEMHVQLVFDQGGIRYRVHRQRKTGKRGASLLELQVWDEAEGTWRGIAEARMRDTQAKIDGLLRMDYETFVNSAFLIQGRADEFTTKTPMQRKQVLANILGLSRWEGYESRAKEAIERVRAELQRQKGRLEEIDRELARRKEYEQAFDAAEAEAQQVARDLEAAEEKWADITRARNELVSLQRQIDDLTRRISSAERELEDAERERVESLASADTAALQAALGEVEAGLTGLGAIREAMEQAQVHIQSLGEEIAHLEGVNRALVPETEPIKERLETLEGSTEPICPTCGQTLSDGERQELVSALRAEVETRREQFKGNRERVNELRANLEQTEKERKSLADQLEVRVGLEKKAGELRAKLEHAEQARERVSKLAARIQRWSGSLEADREKRKSIEALAQESERQMRAAALTQEDVDALRLKKRMADERVGGARQQLEALRAFEEQREERLAVRQRLAQDLGLLEELREAFGRRGVPAMIIETVVPELERSANELLARMTDGRMHVRVETQREIKTGELREALDIIISDELGSRSYELYSGGEAFRINFAIRIALSRLLARRAGAQLRSLFIDEGFGTQDASGREHLIAAINSIQDDFDRILVITHIDELKDAFPARIEVRKTKLGSQFQLT